MVGFVKKLYNSLLPYETKRRLHKIRHLRGYKALRRTIHSSPKGDFSLKPYDENKCIFIHITKTAGTSVAKSLFGYLPYHYKAIDYRVIYGRKTFEQYFKFAFVRNPWDRLYSAFRYLKTGGWNHEDKEWSKKNLSTFDNFTDFVKQWLNKDNIQQHLHFIPQHQFICDGKGNIIIDYLAYFETINDDFHKIAERLNINASIGHHNASPPDSYKEAYTEETRKIVANIYEKDIALFGYKFDGIEKRRIL